MLQRIHHTYREISSESGKFWNFVRKNCFTNSLPKTISFNNNRSSNEIESAYLFANYCSMVYLPYINISYLDSMVNLKIYIKHFTIIFHILPRNCYIHVSDVFQRLSSLRGVFSVDPDGISGVTTLVFLPSFWFIFFRREKYLIAIYTIVTWNRIVLRFGQNYII